MDDIEDLSDYSPAFIAALRKLRQTLPPQATSHEDVFLSAVVLLPKWPTSELAFTANNIPAAVLMLECPHESTEVLVVVVYGGNVGIHPLQSMNEAFTRLRELLKSIDATMVDSRSRH